MSLLKAVALGAGRGVRQQSHHPHSSQEMWRSRGVACANNSHHPLPFRRCRRHGAWRAPTTPATDLSPT
eukprot:150068-Lingulodinium_polyedra.AAC.1